MRNKVKMLLAMGWALGRIAHAVDASPATIKRYFRAELAARDQMRDRLEAERLMQVAELAAAGNVAAHREFARLIERNDRMAIEDRLGKPETAPAKPAPVERIGKKDAAQQMALIADEELAAELAAEASHVRH
ncbi:MAG: hypothetical protein ACK4OP_00425 [Gemmobacter sp.]